ncbi:hypothetical protein ACTA71_008439 [Dictyostelium dimigraforme]
MSSNNTTIPPTTQTPSLEPVPIPFESAGFGNLLFLAIALILCGLVVFIGMKQYISLKRTPIYATFFSFLGWFMCFSIAYLVPLDIIVTDHLQCVIENNETLTGECETPVTYLPYNMITEQWRFLYFGSLILCWIIFPVLQSFSTAGDFRFWERVKRAIKENVILYTFMGIGGLIGVIVILSVKEMDPSSFLSFVMLLANVYGVILITITMGYGLIDVPRNLLRKGSHYAILRNYRVEAVVLKTELEDVKKQLIEHLKLIKTISDRAGEYDPFRIYLDVIISKCPTEYDQLIQEYHAEPLPPGMDAEMLSYKYLVGIHSTLLDLVDRNHSAEVLYERLLGKAFAIEDIIETRERKKQQNGGITTFNEEKSIQWSFKSSKSNAKFEYLWHMYIHPWYFIIVGLICVCLSGIILWSEIVLALVSNPEYSPFYRAIIRMEPGIGLQIFCFIPMIYMCVCSYSTLFKLRISNYYRLVPQQSNTFSIMFSANYLCRLAAPLAYNFIQICHVNQGNTIVSPFDKIMGDMNAFGDNALGKRFTLFFPIFMIVVCIISFFNLHKRLAGSCCIRSLRIVTDTSEGAVDHGLKILKQEREERSLNGGVAPVKTRMSIVKEMFTKKKGSSILVPDNNLDGAGSPKSIDPSNRYKATPTKTSINIPNLSRTYTSASGNVYSSNQDGENGNSAIKPINSFFSSILGEKGNNSNSNNNNSNNYNNNNNNSNNKSNNNSILTSNYNSNSTISKGKDKQGLLSLDKMDFSFKDDDDDHTFDDIEMGAYGTGRKNKK